MSGEPKRLYRVLVVEDNPADVDLLRRALVNAGIEFELTVIEDGAGALAYIRQEGKYAAMPTPDLAAIDLNLPKVSGMEVLEALRRNKELSNVPVAMLTSSVTAKERAKADGLHVDRFIPKPPNFDEFLQIGEVLKEMLLKGQAPIENGPESDSKGN